MDRDFFVPPVDPRQIVAPSKEIYDAMGEDNIDRMIDDLYIQLEQSSIREMFSTDLKAAAKRSAAFFVGLLGGPPIYHQRYGNPMMRARHMPFPIDLAARDVWLACFERVLENADDKYRFPKQHLESFREFLQGFSMWMVNTKSKPESINDEG
jgi:hemoglobin